MIKIEDVEVVGIRKAIKGMRNAMNSWEKRDSSLDRKSTRLNSSHTS